MAQDLINNDLHVNGSFSCKTFQPPAGFVTNTHIQAVAGIEATKVIHQFPLFVSQSGTVANSTTLLHILRASATIASIEAIVTMPATGSDRTVSIDLQKATSASGFASVLNAPIELNSSTVARTVVSGAIANPTLIDNDLLQLVVTVAGALGNQAAGLLVTVTLRENPQ